MLTFRRWLTCAAATVAFAPFVACEAAHDASPAAPRDTVVVFAAASLAAPMRALIDSVARPAGIVVQVEHGASLELARRATELHRVPDVIALADEEVFPDLLMPSITSWYARFARNRMVVAYTARSRYANEVKADSWWRILLRKDVLVGRTDPALAPAGYRALLTYALAEQHYRVPELARQLAARTPARLQRGNAAELAALLEAGELDYIVDYESLARAHHFRWIALPPEIDLGDASRSVHYAGVSVRVQRGSDSVAERGMPIMYGVSVPRSAPHADAGARFVALMLGVRGCTVLRANGLDPLDHPALVGNGAPAPVREVIAP